MRTSGARSVSGGKRVSILVRLFHNSIMLVRLMSDPEFPLGLKLILLAVLAYVVMPFDLLNDIFLPVVGWVDDLMILMWGTNYVLRKTPDDLKAKYLPR